MKPALALALLLAASSASAQEAAYKLIVNASNPATAIKRQLAAQLFMTRSTSWAHGPAGDPVDQSVTSPVRDAFSREILGMPLAAVQDHWRKRMLNAREFPPLVKSSDADVIAYVAKSPGGVGYVLASADLPSTVRVLKVTDPIH